LAIADSMRLCARLYFFNRLPLSPEQRIRFPDARAVLGFLGVSGEGKVQKVLAASWQASAAANAGWLVWRHRNGLTSRTEVTYKLYISPMPERLGEVFSATVAVLTEMRVPAFKVGRDLPGILRPDKLIAYFSDLDLLHATARRLTESIGGVPGHGVPFSAEISSDGLLSWGADPPPVSGQGQVEEQESWRFWITSRLAAALISARGTPVTGTQPWQFAMERVRLEGVDTDTWTPVSGVWKPSTRVSEVSRHGHY
jgi:hypothetical protein